MLLICLPWEGSPGYVLIWERPVAIETCGGPVLRDSVIVVFCLWFTWFLFEQSDACIPEQNHMIGLYNCILAFLIIVE